MIVNCVECGTETYKAKYFYEKAKGNVFCSIVCFQTQKAKKRIPYTCTNCRRVFTLTQAEIRAGRGKFCSRECQNKYQIGKNAPIYVERVKRKCKQCGKEFEYREKTGLVPNRKIFCNKDCRHEFRRVKKIKLVCQQCGNEFEVHPSSLKYNASKFCSKKCGYIHNSGENHFRFTNASSENERLRKSPEYKVWRTSVFIRDNRTCVFCGSRKDIEADHIKPFSLFPELALELANGRTLCHECHMKTDSYMNPYMKRQDYE